MIVHLWPPTPEEIVIVRKVEVRKRADTVVEAMRWDGTYACAEEICIAFGGGALGIEAEDQGRGGGVVRLWCATAGGKIQAHPGDTIIRGAEGDVYPCTASVFRRNYDVSGGVVPLHEHVAPRCQADLENPDWWRVDIRPKRCPEDAAFYDYDLYEHVCAQHIVQPDRTMRLESMRSVADEAETKRQAWLRTLRLADTVGLSPRPGAPREQWLYGRVQGFERRHGELCIVCRFDNATYVYNQDGRQISIGAVPSSSTEWLDKP